jgi:hypothetical protein
MTHAIINGLKCCNILDCSRFWHQFLIMMDTPYANNLIVVVLHLSFFGGQTAIKNGLKSLRNGSTTRTTCP